MDTNDTNIICDIGAPLAYWCRVQNLWYALNEEKQLTKEEKSC